MSAISLNTLSQTVESILSHAETAERSWSQASASVPVSAASDWLEQYDAAVEGLVKVVLSPEGRFLLGFGLGAFARAQVQAAGGGSIQAGVVEVCAECDIADCRHIRARREAAAMTAKAGEKSMPMPWWLSVNHPGDEA